MSTNDDTRNARARQQSLLKPPGSLGLLEDLAIRLAGIQKTATPQARPAAALIFAADHPVAQRGVSAYPQDVTRSMMKAFSSGGAASTTIANALDVSLEVIDVGVEGSYELPANARHRITRDPVAKEPVGDLAIEPAMSESVCAAALQAGARAVDRLDPSVKVLLLGEMGIGNTTVASALASRLLDVPARDVVGPGTGLDQNGVERKVRVVEQALDRTARVDQGDVLRELGGREIAALCGAIQRSAETGRVILVDGFIVSTAALWCLREDRSCHDHLLFSHRSAEPAHGRVLEALDARPLLDLELRLGEATGALAALPLLDLACEIHNHMWSFADAGLQPS